MPFIYFYLILLFIAPQLWIEPFVGLRPDLYLYAAWFGWVFFSGRAVELVRFGAQDWLFAGWLAWIVISLGVNGFRPMSSEIVVDYAKWFVLFRLTVVTLPTFAHVRHVAWILLFFGLLLAVEGIQHANSPTGTGWAGQELGWVGQEAIQAGYEGRTQWINIFDGPGVFCVVYTISLPFAMQYLVKPYGVSVRLMGMMMMAPLLLATYYTGSRGGFLATLGVFGLFALARIRVSPAKLVLAFGILLAGISAAPDYLSSTSDSNRSAQYRVEMWGEGVEMVQQNPVFGIGKGNFADYTGKLIAHNSAIEIMGETGVPGFFLWLSLIYMAFKTLLAAYREMEDPRSRSYVVALGLSLAGYLLSSLFVTLEYETFYFLLAIPAAIGGTLRTRPKFTRRDVMWIAGVMAAYFVLVKGFVMLYF